MRTSIQIAFTAMALGLASPGVPAAQSDAAAAKEKPKKTGGDFGTPIKMPDGTPTGTDKALKETEKKDAKKSSSGKNANEAIVNPCNGDRPPSWCN